MKEILYGKEMATGINYFLESDVIICRCNILSLKDSMLRIFTAVGSALPVPRGSASFVNFETGEMGMYGGIIETSSDLTVRYSRPIGFKISEGHEYVIEMTKRDKKHTLKITDAYTLESDIITVMPTDSNDVGEHWGRRSYSVSGGVNVNSFRNFSLEPHKCRLLIIGDSFVEGASVFANQAERYCMKIKETLNGSCAISGFGGARTEQVADFYESYCKTLFVPDYVLLACGTNNLDYSTWLIAEQKLIASVRAAGSIPILVTITPRLDTDNSEFIKRTNAWIRDYSNELYIDINRITTLDFDGKTMNEKLFCDDKVHPLPLAHDLIFKRALLDVSEVFCLSAN